MPAALVDEDLLDVHEALSRSEKEVVLPGRVERGAQQAGGALVEAGGPGRAVADHAVAVGDERVEGRCGAPSAAGEERRPVPTSVSSP